MPNSSKLQQQVSKAAGLSMVLAAGLWVVMLIMAAVRARQLAGAHDVSIGPLVLNQIVRIPTENGWTVSFSFEKGLLLYLLAFAVIGAAVGYLKARRS